MNKIDLALDQIASGDFQIGLDTIWAEIEAGSNEARVALANEFTAVGLHAFAQDQWLYLLENGSEFAQEAATGAVGNAVWMRQYGQAAELLDSNPELKADYGTYVADSYRDFCTLSFEVVSFAEGIEQHLQEDRILEGQRLNNQTLEALLRQLTERENLFNIACDLAFNPPGLHSQIAVELPVVGFLTGSRPAIQAVGAPIYRAEDYLTTIGLTIEMFRDSGNFKGDEHFLEVTRRGKAIANKILLLLDGDSMSGNTSIGIENVCWALGQSESTDEQFAGFVLGGVIDDDAPVASDSSTNGASLTKSSSGLGASAPQAHAPGRFCSSCGHEFAADNVKFCSSCGHARNY